MFWCLHTPLSSQVTLVVKNLPSNAGDIREGVGSLGLEDSLEKGWQLIPVFLPGESHGQRCLVGYDPKGPKMSDMAEDI